jgi:CubicO group peptidase (beta-lactamase class C family)
MSIPTDQVDQLFSAWDKPNSPGCVLTVIHDGAVVYQRAYGMADLERHVPLSTGSVLDLGSVGKQFTAVLLALMAQRGLLSLDDPVRQHVPELPDYAQPITIRHLIHHTSGLRDYPTLMDLCNKPTENAYFDDELFDLIVRQKELNFAPGDEYLYSNSGYLLLGVIASRVAGKSYPDLVREYILQPLGMSATTFNDTFKRIVPDRALAYSPNEAGGFDTDISFCGGYGDGAILSTVGDLFKWDQNFYDNQLGGGQALIAEIETPATLNDGEATDYAFGLAVRDYKGLRTVSHGGAWAGYRAAMLRFPDQRFTVICLANLSAIRPSTLVERVADLYLADQFTQPAEAAEAHSTADQPAAPAIGAYRSQIGGSLAHITAADDGLTLTLMGYPIPIQANGAGRWLPVDPDWDVEITVPADDALSIRLWGGKPTIYRKLLADSTIAPELAGTYYSPELDIRYRIAHDGEALTVRRGFAPPQALQPVTRDLYASSYMVFEFTRGADGQPQGFTLSADRVVGIRFERQA